AVATTEPVQVEISPTLRVEIPPDGWPEFILPQEKPYAFAVRLLCETTPISLRGARVGVPLTVVAEVLDDATGRLVQEIPLQEDPARPGRYTGQLTDLAPGRYALKARVRADGQLLIETSTGPRWTVSSPTGTPTPTPTHTPTVVPMPTSTPTPTSTRLPPSTPVRPRLPTVRATPPLTIRLDEPLTPYLLPRDEQPRYGFVVRGQVTGLPAPEPMFVTISDGQELARSALDIQPDGKFTLEEVPDVCRMLAANDDPARFWQLAHDRLWLERDHQLAFYRGDEQATALPTPASAPVNIETQITPALRLSLPPDGWPAVFSPNERMDVGAFLTCGNRRLSLQGSAIAGRVRAVAVIRGEGRTMPQEPDLAPTITGDRDFTGSVLAPTAEGMYNLTVELRHRESGAVLLSTSPVTWRASRVTPTPTRPPAEIRLYQPASTYRLPRATAPRYGLPIQGRVVATPVPTPIFVLARDAEGRERFRTSLVVKENGDFSASSTEDVCELLATDEEAIAQAWRFNGTRLWLQEVYDLSFYVGNVKHEPPPQALAVFPARRVEIAPAFRLRPPPDGFARSYSPGERLDVRAYTSCGGQRVFLQDSLWANRVQAIALLSKEGSNWTQQVPLQASVGRGQDFIGQVLAPTETGTYTLRVEIRPLESQTKLLATEPITFAVISP
ncbi:MAG: hypothetical protein ISS49_18405, partial [Anaerolineae bacterium]|nr:hypothetical protein [Anaerolineae bacterium]